MYSDAKLMKSFQISKRKTYGRTQTRRKKYNLLLIIIIVGSLITDEIIAHVSRQRRMRESNQINKPDKK